MCRSGEPARAKSAPSVAASYVANHRAHSTLRHLRGWRWRARVTHHEVHPTSLCRLRRNQPRPRRAPRRRAGLRSLQEAALPEAPARPHRRELPKLHHPQRPPHPHRLLRNLVRAVQSHGPALRTSGEITRGQSALREARHGCFAEDGEAVEDPIDPDVGLVSWREGSVATEWGDECEGVGGLGGAGRVETQVARICDRAKGRRP